jgi:hypothetical protein
MAIFNSYVKLPEGMFLAGGESHPTPKPQPIAEESGQHGNGTSKIFQQILLQSQD